MNTAFNRRQSDDGFSLIEILVVMIIIGLLASIAIPLYLDQQKKSHDAAAKSDVNSIANAMVGYLANHSSFPVMVPNGATITVNGDEFARLSPGVVLGEVEGNPSEDWCVDVTHPNGDRAKVKGYKFTSAEGKVEEGQCS